MATDLRTIPSNARYLAILAKEKRRVFQRLQALMNEFNVHLDTADYEAGNLSGNQIFQVIQRHCPGLNEVVIHNDNINAAAVLIDQVLSMTICNNYSAIITQQILHIEFLDKQICWISEEIERDVIAKQKKSMPISWDDAFALIDTLPGIDQPTTIDILADAGFDMEQYQEQFTNYQTATTFPQPTQDALNQAPCEPMVAHLKPVRQFN